MPQHLQVHQGREEPIHKRNALVLLELVDVKNRRHTQRPQQVRRRRLGHSVPVGGGGGGGGRQNVAVALRHVGNLALGIEHQRLHGGAARQIALDDHAAQCGARVLEAGVDEVQLAA